MGRHTPLIETRRQQLLASGRTLAAPLGNERTEPIRLGELTKLAAIPPARGKLLATLATFAPSGIRLELGSNVGIGTAYLAQVAAEQRGHVLSIEGVPAIAETAKTTLRATDLYPYADIICKDFDDWLDVGEKWIARRGELTFAFIDGSHQYAPTMRYAKRVQSLCVPGAMIVLDDLSQNDGMKKAWRELSRDTSFGAAWTDGRFGILSVVQSPG